MRVNPITASPAERVRRRWANSSGSAQARIGRARLPTEGLLMVSATSQPVTVVPRLAPRSTKYASDNRRRPTCTKLTAMSEVTLLDWRIPVRLNPER